MKNKVTVIYHSADFDGLFCREIARKFLPEAELIGWDFKDAPLDSSLLHSSRLIIMDLPVDRVFGLKFRDGWICRGDEQIQPIDRWESSNVTWIDHHASSIASHPETISGLRIDGVAACRLAWQWFSVVADTTRPMHGFLTKDKYVNREVEEPLAVRLAGEYDIWDKRDPNAETFQFGLRSQELTDLTWRVLLCDDAEMEVEGLLHNGRLLQKYQRLVDAEVMGRAFMVEFEGLKFLALNAVRFNSLTFMAKDVPATGHDALLGFYFDGQKFNFSLYHAQHNSGIDLSLIAKKYGGGGHRGACGFIWHHEVLPWERRDLKTPLDANGKRPYLFYYEEATGCHTPAPELVENIINTDNLADGETMEIEFKRTDMTPEEFAAIPEI